LDEVTVALLVFDAHSETDPFSGIHYWNRAVNLAQRNSSIPIKKILVAARTDRGAIGVSKDRIKSFRKEIGADGYFETSAKTGKQTAKLSESIRRAISWNDLPKVISTELFHDIKAFIIKEKKAGRLLLTADELYHSFMKTRKEKSDDFRASFDTCIGRVEARDLIRRLSYGDLILLQPELLDGYASSMINAAKEEPDGMGCIHEDIAKTGKFPIPTEGRLKDKEQENLLLLATIEDLLRHETALREHTTHGPHIVFPSQFTRENPELPNPKGRAVTFNFEGAVQNIYTTLVVRLAHSDIFQIKEMWKNACMFNAKIRGEFGIHLNHIVEDGRADLTLFFAPKSSKDMRLLFEDYVEKHLRHRALPDTVKRRRIFVCPDCNKTIADDLVQARKERGHDTMNCPVCDYQGISLADWEEQLAAVPSSQISKIDQSADKKRDSETAISILEGKRKTGQFDVFLCHNTKDKPAVKEIGKMLEEKGILPWLDEWELQPGLPWQRVLEQQIGQIKSAAVFVGKKGIGPWQQMELEAFLREFVNRSCPVIPVVLPNAPKKPKLPIFLKGMKWVDFRKKDPDPLDQLIWGITGEKNGRGVGA
jgi:hypothetical protein